MLEIHMLTAQGPLLQCMLYCSEYVKRSALHICELGLLCLVKENRDLALLRAVFSFFPKSRTAS